jgi:hypothetical protein
MVAVTSFAPVPMRDFYQNIMARVVIVVCGKDFIAAPPIQRTHDCIDASCGIGDENKIFAIAAPINLRALGAPAATVLRNCAKGMESARLPSARATSPAVSDWFRASAE